MNLAALILVATLSAAPASQAEAAGALLRPEQLRAVTDPARVFPERSTEAMWWQAGGGVAAAAIATPASIALGSLIGTLSPSLVVAALPALIAFIALPPLAVVLTEWLVGKWLHFPSARLTPALWVGLGAQALLVTGAILLGADAQNLGHIALLTLVEAIVLPSLVTWSMRPPASSPAFAASPLDERRPTKLRAAWEAPGAVTVPVVRFAL